MLGLIFQALAIASVVLTLVAANVVARAGDQIGINGAHDPLTWFVLGAGVFVALMFTGVGHILGMMCAVYDRQEAASATNSHSSSDATFQSEVRRQQKKYSSTVWEQVVELDEQGETSQPLTAPILDRDMGPRSATHLQRLGPTSTAQRPKSGLWEWITRERHFTRRSGR